MKSKKFILKWLAFIFLGCCCSVFFGLSFDQNTPSLSKKNVEALADWEDDFQEVTKYCDNGNGWCIYNATEFYGLIFVEK